jgi:hypothetical protein
LVEREADVGQAKLKKETIREKALEMSQRWNFPPSQWEANVCEELADMPVTIVPRVPAEQIRWMRMPANECHANTQWYAENDPSGKSKRVTGWWVQWPNYVLHSVLEQDGRLFCITPTFPNDPEIPFIVDLKIEWKEDGNVYSAWRDGERIGVGVRAYPALTIAQTAIVTERLRAGVDPDKAQDFTEEDMERLKRVYTPEK